MKNTTTEKNNQAQMTLDINNDGTVTIVEENIKTSMQLDADIFSDAMLEEMKNLNAAERLSYFNNIYEKFYKENIEYTLFFGRTDRPKYLEETKAFLLDLTESDFKKCHISLSKFDKLQQIIIRNAAKIDVADIALIATDILTEPELAALYYLKYPRSETAITEFLTDPTAYPLPFGPYLFLMNDAVAHAAAKRNFSFEVTKGGRKKSDRTKSIEVAPVKNGFELTQRKKGESATITILNKDLIQSTSAMKLFVFLITCI